jgi:small subunit ribosomal protein S17
MSQATPAGRRQEKIGTVVSTRMQKTIVVEVSRRVSHPLYRKYVKRRKKFHAHDEEGRAHVGDVVRIVECRPLSKTKRWRLEDILRKAARVGEAEAPSGQVEATAALKSKP